LQGEWRGFRDAHIEPDWLLIYKINADVARFECTGRHTDLFDEQFLDVQLNHVFHGGVVSRSMAMINFYAGYDIFLYGCVTRLDNPRNIEARRCPSVPVSQEVLP
jgi:hypothetical protein